MNVEIVEIVNLGARSVGLSRIHFSDDPQRKRSNNKDYFHIEKAENSTSSKHEAEIQKLIRKYLLLGFK